MVLFKNPVNSSLRDNGNQLLSLYICLVLNGLMFKLVLTRDIVLHPREPLPVKCCRASFILTQNLSIKSPCQSKAPINQQQPVSQLESITHLKDSITQYLSVQTGLTQTQLFYLFLFRLYL